MSQYINLLTPAFRKQRVVLKLNRASLLTAAAAVIMIVVQMYNQQLVNGVQEELSSAQMLLKVQGAYTSRLLGENAGQKGNTALDVEVQQLEQELKSARNSMSVLEGGALGNREGFARYMQAFSRQALDGLWLTGFTLAGSGDVSIEGRVMRPELVPVYIQRLNGEPALKGREFSALEMRRPPPAPDTARGVQAESQMSAVPRFLEFALATGDPVPPTAATRQEKR